MKKILLFFKLIPVIVISQNYQIGHRQVIYVDSSRNNRQILTHIYYPSNIAGENVTIANGQFPLIVFGHGFLMGYDSYLWLKDSLTPLGYIIAFPTTEGGMLPNHEEFGKDLKFLNYKIKNENNNNVSFLYNHVSNYSAIMGHSMGGGASFLAASNNNNLTTLITFAPAETTPSAISAAMNVNVPTLIFAGENDGVTPPSENQIPMYNSCASNCKTLITIKGGGHCYFANYNFNCSFGEMTTTPQPTITREQQISRTFKALYPYIQYYLKNNTQALNQFLSIINNSNFYSYQRNCNNTSTKEFINDNINLIYSNNLLVVENPKKGTIFINIYDIVGRKYISHKTNTDVTINTSSLNTGIYFVEIKSLDFNKLFKIFIN
ncbi:MAG: T9SS type A sorting domain-containing protein [Bacteroidales bacterium]|nr:T9SS type A sorting domain-containing protein [Bacteroidales bacterium]